MYIGLTALAIIRKTAELAAPPVGFDTDMPRYVFQMLSLSFSVLLIVSGCRQVSFVIRCSPYACADHSRHSASCLLFVVGILFFILVLFSLCVVYVALISFCVCVDVV